ncbi:sensor histidine kinase [Streptomyces sp. AK02-01A]|uniref:sensor histidine kinase n=1 Tax=Streptomyces sp. AK02-01A TaxID=3028648 RepID=UPI0029B6B3A4|nr:ATP-binding protein [Streptomyces sp. AK02-01A]MDX3855856.1 hypothetical protein [Streptomyces sp. AK02-01A]
MRLRRLTVVPVLFATANVGAVCVVCAAGSGGRGIAAAAAGVVGWVATLVVACRQSTATAAALHRRQQDLEDRMRVRITDLEAVVTAGLADVRLMTERVAQGERPQPPQLGLSPQVHVSGDVFLTVERSLHRAFAEAVHAVAQAGLYQPPDQVKAFVSIARRLHALVDRALRKLDVVEKQVEDPDLLHGLFQIDHLATRMRRHAESLAVLGGAMGRKINDPVPLGKSLRQAISEIEHFSRAHVVGTVPADVAIVGYSAADVIHALAELVENGTRFSPGRVEVRAGRVGAGVAVEIDDRGGLAMTSADTERWNRLLSSAEVDVRKHLQEGRIGLPVTALIAQRHGIRITLSTNHLGGTRATVVLPPALLTAPKPVVLPTVTTSAPAVGAGPQPYAVPLERPAVRGLPRRGAGAADKPAARPSPVPDAEGRPPLPRRSDAPVDSGERSVASPPTGTTGPASSALMARFTSGVKRAEAGGESAPSARPLD